MKGLKIKVEVVGGRERKKGEGEVGNRRVI
jgi:hypothetical protein